MNSRYWLLAALTAACTTGDNTPPSNELVSTAAEPAGVNCAAGGVAITSGVDKNDNGTLDPDEITSTSYVCAGANGTDGTNGANGANGTNGANGSNGSSVLVAVVAEPPGVNCATGGNAIESGLDTNHNNVLDANEVTSTTYLCNATNPTTIQGSITVQNSVQAAQLVGVQHITGNLTIDAAGLTSIDLTSLVAVDGTFQLRTYSGTSIALPALTSVGGDLGILPTLTTASLGALTTVGGALSISGSAAVTLPNLASVGAVSIYNTTSDVDLPALVTESSMAFQPNPIVVSVPALVHGHSITSIGPTLDAPSMIDIDQLTLNGVNDVRIPALVSAHSIVLQATNLTAFPFSQLTTFSSVWLQNNASSIALSSPLAAMDYISLIGPGTLDLPNLTTVGTLDVESTPGATIGLPALQTVTGQFEINGNSALTTLAFPALTSVHYFQVSNNPVYSQCAATSLQQATQVWPNYYYNVYSNGPC